MIFIVRQAGSGQGTVIDSVRMQSERGQNYLSDEQVVAATETIFVKHLAGGSV